MPQRLLQIVTKHCAACAVVLLFGTLSAQAGDLLVRVQGNPGDAPLYLGLVNADRQAGSRYSARSRAAASS